MSEAKSSNAMKNLVWFIVVLAVFGIILALVFVFAGFITADPAVAAPLNGVIPPAA
jgi:hypothetical protein